MGSWREIGQVSSPSSDRRYNNLVRGTRNSPRTDRAILNSRPLTALSDDPSDLTVLMPGHFLVDSALNSVPEPSLEDIPEIRLSRWQLLRQLMESFWRRWSSEYLHQFQTLPKWYRKRRDFRVDDLVMLKDERLPPTKRPLARVLEIHPGPDRLIRVVTVKTATTTFKRPIVKLCLLPSVNDQSLYCNNSVMSSTSP